jgi:8-oxo-dGTP pyrophosphatase MutT (NUDIX family)
MSDYMRRLRERVGHDLLEVPSASVAIRDRQGRVLLGRHATGNVWVMPGGAIEPEETPADAAVREAWEETGLVVRLTRLLGVYGGPECTVEYENGDRTCYLIVVFEGEAEAGTERCDGEEMLELRYFGLDELDGPRLARWMPELIATLRGGSREPAFRAAAWTPPPGASW